jgi:hypothetical protein
MNMLVGSAAVATAAAIPQPSVAAPSIAPSPTLPLSVNDARPELRDACRALEAAFDELLATGRAHCAAYDLYADWEEKNRPPASDRAPRAFKKWLRRADKKEEEIGLHRACDAWTAACGTYRKAQEQLAHVRAVNFDELFLKSAAAWVFEGAILQSKEDRRCLRLETQYVGMSVAMDCVLLAGYKDDGAIRQVIL